MKKQTNNNELIFFADLYIADSTFTNFIPIAMGKEAIFVNFFNLPSVESAKGCFGIKKFIEAWDEFEKLLELFRDGNLPRQYEFDEKILINNSLRKILDWIGYDEFVTEHDNNYFRFSCSGVQKHSANRILDSLVRVTMQRFNIFFFIFFS